MQWFNSISELEYYNTVPNIGCYCDPLVYPSDITLQGFLYNGANPYTVTLYTYSADGLTQYENSTSFFSVYTAKDTLNRDYFNARLNQFTTNMCTHKCFLIRAVVTTSNGSVVFDKYTSRYCQSDCCDTVRGVTYSQDGIAQPSSGDAPFTNPVQPVGTCGQPLIRIISRFDCIDNFTGNFFADPVVLYSGTADFNYTVITSCTGRIVRRPRDIRREISYNCRLQQTESEPTYLLESYDMFPAWKMYEIEGQLHANHIWVDNYIDNPIPEYVFNGGQPFEKITGANSCTEVFKLSVTLNGCVQRQIYGCVEDCTGTGMGFIIIPASYQETGFYDDNGLFVAAILDGGTASPYVTGLLQWLMSQDGITSATEVDITGFECEPYTYAIVQITGTGLIPNSIYMDAPVGANRLFTVIANSTADLCGYIGAIPCPMPVNDTVTISTFACATPVNDTVIITEITPTTLTISDYGNWLQNSSTASLYTNQVTFDLDTTNTAVIVAMGEDYLFSGDIIGTVSAEGRPATLQALTGGVLPADTTVTIDSTGAIRYYGSVNAAVANEIDIVITGLTYTV